MSDITFLELRSCIETHLDLSEELEHQQELVRRSHQSTFFENLDSFLEIVNITCFTEATLSCFLTLDQKHKDVAAQARLILTTTL